MTRSSSNPKSIIPADDTVGRPTRDNAQHDGEILRLWEANWTARKIADYLGIKTHTVNYVIHKNGRARKPQGPRTIRVSAQDAPVEAWQQAMLPTLEQDADDFGMKGAWKSAYILMCLLLAKKHDSMPSFIDWACKVTGYVRDDIQTLVERGECSHLIVEGQPDEAAFRRAVNAEDGGDIALLLMVGVFEGTFERTVDDLYYLAGMPLNTETARWEDDGGYSVVAA